MQIHDKVLCHKLLMIQAHRFAEHSVVIEIDRIGSAGMLKNVSGLEGKGESLHKKEICLSRHL